MFLWGQLFWATLVNPHLDDGNCAPQLFVHMDFESKQRVAPFSRKSKRSGFRKRVGCWLSGHHPKSLRSSSTGREHRIQLSRRLPGNENA